MSIPSHLCPPPHSTKSTVSSLPPQNLGFPWNTLPSFLCLPLLPGHTQPQPSLLLYCRKLLSIFSSFFGVFCFPRDLQFPLLPLLLYSKPELLTRLPMILQPHENIATLSHLHNYMSGLCPPCFFRSFFLDSSPFHCFLLPLSLHPPLIILLYETATLRLQSHPHKASRTFN